MLRKLLFSMTALLAFSQFSSAQCIADAGPDQHRCQTFTSMDTLILGGSPTASGGQAPYTYQWSIDPIIIGSTILDASIYLDDTTSANPTLGGFSGNELTFYLKVTDGQNSVCYDTVTVTNSLFTQHLGTVGFTINAGDSIQLAGPNVWSTFPTDSVLWRPNHGLIDSNAIRPWAKPTRDITYYCTVWDTAGCSQKGGAFQYVTVNHVGLSENEATQVELYPTLLKEESLLHVNLQQANGNQVLTISDLTGKTVKSVSLQQTKKTIDLGHLPKETYIYSILSDGKLIKQGKLIRN